MIWIQVINFYKEKRQSETESNLKSHDYSVAELELLAHILFYFSTHIFIKYRIFKISDNFLKFYLS